MKPLIIANWKMNFTLNEAINFVAKLDKTIKSNIINFIIASPILYIPTLQQISSKITFCSQDVSLFNPQGAMTGELSAKMIKSCGINYSIIGHSERRFNFSENNKIIQIKAKNCLDADITPIICVGETKEERDSGNYKKFILKQIKESTPLGAQNVIIAYEPLWSIGAGNTASVRKISEIVDFIRVNQQALVAKNVSIVYGGSVSSNNYKDIVAIPGIAGVLVGAASLDVKELTNMLN